MKELLEYRVKLVERLSEAAHEFQTACLAVKDPFEKVDGDWTLHQMASHLRDVSKLVYGARIYRTLKEDNPSFKNFDADDWMAQHYNKEEAFASILSEFLAEIEELAATLNELPLDAWSRESTHERMGGALTSQLWVERNLQHIEEHLLAVKRV
jgi:hypothetical protein